MSQVVVLGQQRPLGGVHLRVRPGAVAVPEPEGERPDAADRAEEIERPPPVHPVDLEQEDQQHGRERARPAGADPQQALGLRALGGGEPDRERPRDVREAARLAGAEEEADHDQGKVAPGPPGEGGEDGPPDDDSREDLPRAEAVAEPAARDLEDRVREGERGVDDPHLFGVEVELRLDLRARLRDADPIDIEDCRDRAGEGDDPVADVGRSFRVVHQGRLIYEESRIADYESRRPDQFAGALARSACGLIGIRSVNSVPLPCSLRTAISP